MLLVYMHSWLKDDAIWIPKFANYFSFICGIRLIWSHYGKMFQMHYNEIMNMYAVTGNRICSSWVLRGLLSGRTSVKHVWSPCFWQLYHMCTYIHSSPQNHKLPQHDRLCDQRWKINLYFLVLFNELSKSFKYQVKHNRQELTQVKENIFLKVCLCRFGE